MSTRPRRPVPDPDDSTSLPADRGRWSVSPMNWSVVGILAASAVLAAIQGRWSQAIIAVVMSAGWWAGARVARWRDSSDRERVLSFEPADEREEGIERRGLATAGRFAMLFLLAQSVLLFHFTLHLWWYAAGTLAALVIVWYVASSRAVRRS